MTSTVDSPDVLAAIVAATRKTLEIRASHTDIQAMERRAAGVEPRRGMFGKALGRNAGLNVIAECKRRSPSQGVLKADYNPAAIAKGYENAGAAAISVLTESTFFDGSLDHLVSVRSATDLPILRKDFILDRYQIFEARAAGADAILLVAAALCRSTLARLHREAVDAGLDALVEVHDLSELQIAVEAGASIVGINNRNLRTLAVDPELSIQAVKLIPEGVIAVAESGLKSREDLQRLKAAGYDAFLMGEALMATPDPGTALGEILKGSIA
jgi:indole-3-glycerol phosphate synthase